MYSLPGRGRIAETMETTDPNRGQAIFKKNAKHSSARESAGSGWAAMTPAPRAGNKNARRESMDGEKRTGSTPQGGTSGGQ